MQIEPLHASTEHHRNPFAAPQIPQRASSTSSTASTTSTNSTPSDSSDSPDHYDPTSSRSTPRPRAGSGYDENSAAAMALLGLSMRPSSTESPYSQPAPDHKSEPSAIGMTVTLSSGSESGSSNTGSTGSTRVSSQKKRRSSDSSSEIIDQTESGRGKRTRAIGSGSGSGAGGSPPVLKPKSDGWSDEMKRSYEEAAFAIPPSGREQRRLFGDMRGRNEQLGLWVTLEIGTYCGRKRISSHSQTLKNHHGTNPELKKVLTTDGTMSAASADSNAWPIRLKELVHAAYSSLSPPPRLPPAKDLDLANLPVPAISVRVLRKDGVEIEMTLPEAIEYDKADQRAKNREKKPVSRSRGKKSRTATPAHSRAGSARKPPTSTAPLRPPPPPSSSSGGSGGSVARQSDPPHRGRHQSHGYATATAALAISTSPLLGPHSRSESGPSTSRSAELASPPTYFRTFADGSRELPPPIPSPQASSVPLPDRMAPPRRYSTGGPATAGLRQNTDGADPWPNAPAAARPRQPNAASLDFILAEPIPPELKPPQSPITSRTFWK